MLMMTLLLIATPTGGCLGKAGKGTSPLPALLFQKGVVKAVSDKNPHQVSDQAGEGGCDS